MTKFATALYGRTSKDDAKRVTIEIQQARLRRWGKEDDGVSAVVGEFWDEGVSGKIPLGERPAGGEMLSAIKAGQIKCVAVVYADRFGRTLLDGLQAARDLELMGVNIVCVEEGWDGRRKDSPLNFQLRLLLAEEEHRRIKQRMQGGKERAMMRDNAPPTSVPMFGYRVDASGQYVIHPPEAVIVSRVFELALTGVSNRKIVEWIRSQNVPAGRMSQARGGEARIQACHANVKWHPSRIGKILRNRTYSGTRVWRDIEFPCPAIVDVETFNSVQTINLSRTAVHTPKVDPEESLVSGLFKCALCDHPYYFRRYKSNTRPRKTPGNSNYYSCNGKHVGSKFCPSKKLSVEQVDTAVWAVVEDYLSNPEEMIAKSVQAGLRITEGVKVSNGTEEKLLADIDDIERQVKETWEEQQQNGWPMTWVSSRLNGLNEGRKSLEKELSSVRRCRLKEEEQAGDVASVVPMIAAARAELTSGISRHKQHDIIRKLVPGGVLRTIGQGRKKSGELTMQLRWGELVQVDSAPFDLSKGIGNLQFPIVILLGRKPAC